MRYFFLLILSSWLSFLPQLKATATESPLASDPEPLNKGWVTQPTAKTSNTQTDNQILAQLSPSPDFWRQAQRLVQQQIYIINRIERALSGSDPNLAFATEGQITLHLGEVERFLRQQFPIPSLLCTRTNGLSAEGSSLTFEQTQVYCTLYATTQQLTPLRPVLERRQSNLGATSLFPLTNSERTRERVSIPEANVPPAEPPIVGQPAKTPISGYEPPLDPAVAPSATVLTTLQSVRQQLSQVIAAFPPSTRFIDSAENIQRIEELAYTLNPAEVKLYDEFVNRPNQGIARVLPAQVYVQPPNQLRNRLIPSVLERYPFAPLLRQVQYRRTQQLEPRPEEGFVPRLTLRVENGNFQIAQLGLDYGFMTDLGEVSLDDLDSRLDKARILLPETQQLFLNYRPPTQLEALQTDRRRFITGKVGEIAFSESVIKTELIQKSLNRVSTTAPVTLKHTYLMRLIQFQLPEFILTKEPIRRSDRRYLQVLLETPSSDLLVAFQPVNRRRDGSYTVLWRVLNQFPNPQIEDLEKYIFFQ